MKKILVLALFLAACAERTNLTTVRAIDGRDGTDGTSCFASEAEGGVLISCGDGSSILLASGQDGQDGVDGQDGQDGVDGQDGQDGASCSVSSVTGGANITCGTTTVLISNGTNSTLDMDYTEIGSSCKALNGLPGYHAKKEGNGSGASAKVYTSKNNGGDDCDTLVTSMSSTDEIQVLNENTVLLYQSSTDKVFVLKVGN